MLAIALVCALLGIAYALLASHDVVESVGYAMALGGGLACFVVAMAGSPAQRAGESRYVVGGRFVEGSDRPQPESPFILIPASLAVLAIGMLLLFVVT